MGKFIAVVIIIVLGVGGYFYMKSSQTMAPADNAMEQTTMTASPSPLAEMMSESIALDEQNDSGQSGTAMLSEKDGKVMVTLDLQGSPKDTPQPAHIHLGSCPDVGAVAYPLTNVVNGKSETTLDVSMTELGAKQPLGINIHKSAAEAKVYTACGDLNIPVASSMPKSASESSMSAN